ncbi:MAG: hypothetical protein HZA91_12865 [Verrucomicrobia bacterium]|nr:hypothetical protein [Verrucomicrobiota bacterium]
MTTPPLSPTAANFKDRRAGLIVFGILVILLGCLCALLLPLMFAGQAFSAKLTGGAASYRMIIPGALIYGWMAVAFIWLGIGSVLCRRWARALLLTLSWCWLVVGIVSTVIMAFVLPQILAVSVPEGQKMPEAARWMIAVVMVGTISVIYVLLPGALVLFYRSRHVKATCEARDPVRRWTDACPLPVLAVSLMLAFSAFSMLSMPLAFNSVMPFFGKLISGAPATMLCLGITLLMAWAARAIYRLEPAAWWVMIAFFAVMMVSGALTFARIDLIEMYRQMGFPPDQLAQMEKFSFVRDRSAAWWMSLSAVPFFGYLIWVKRYFRRAT